MCAAVHYLHGIFYKIKNVLSRLKKKKINSLTYLPFYIEKKKKMIVTNYYHTVLCYPVRIMHIRCFFVSENIPGRFISSGEIVR